jgi:hypothetical protein
MKERAAQLEAENSQLRQQLGEAEQQRAEIAAPPGINSVQK